MRRKLGWRGRWDIRRGHNELAVRAGTSRPARGYWYRMLKGRVRAMTKKPGRRLRRNQVGTVLFAEHPLHRINAWKATSAWYQSFGGEENYQREMAKYSARRHGVGPITYAVERAIEEQFPVATEEEWHALADRIVNEVIWPVQQKDGVWRMYPVTNADEHFGRREYETTRWEYDARTAEPSQDEP